jgi:predicted TPR repeat methyltransferase
MSRYQASMPSSYFDDLYAEHPDPWSFAANQYERDKYAATIASLSKPRYRHGLEVGCSIGVLTRELAGRCDALLSVDVARVALDRASRRCADLPQVRFAVMRVPDDWPIGRFDLIVLSEVVYYLDRSDIARLAAKTAESIEPGGDIVLVHWLGETNYPISGHEAAEHFIEAVAPFAAVRSQARNQSYRLDVLTGLGKV